jgi:putative ABC transport system permease protein
MLHNYLITALRNFTRHKLYSFINIAGLTVGLTCAIFIILFVRDEISYDKWIPGTENLYRAEVTFRIPGQPPIITTASVFPAVDAMQAQIPEVKAAAHLEPRQMTVAVGNRQFFDPVNVVSPNFFHIVQLPLIAGDRSTLFAQPETAVISESAARKYFGTSRALGKMLHVVGGCEWDVPDCHIREASVIVTGIMRDLPHNTQLLNDVFIPNTSTADPTSPRRKADWFSSSGFGYVELAPHADPKQVLIKFRALVDRSFDPSKTQGIRQSGSQVLDYRLTPFRDDHLSTDRYGSMTPPGDWTAVYGFITIAVLILLVACFNFTNLATARAMVRAQEISLRKVMGAKRAQLMVQFLGESVLTALIAFVFALALTEILLPAFDRMAGKPITLDYFSQWPLLAALLGLAVLAGLIAGLYPALMLSGFRPASVLRANPTWHSGSGLARTALVVTQFAVSIGLGIAALVVFAQISFARSIDLGLDKDGIVVVYAGSMAPGAIQSLTQALNADPALKGAAWSGDVPFSGNTSNTTIEIPGVPGNSLIRRLTTGQNFFSLYRIRLLSGRYLSETHGEDVRRAGAAHNILINEAAARRFGASPEGALGKSFFLYRGDNMLTAYKERVTVVGVTADVKLKGDREEVQPTYYDYDPGEAEWVSVRVPAGGISQGLAALDRTWHRFSPSFAISRQFLDANFEKDFQIDERQGIIFDLFVGIAIFIACLGLFGLAAFSTQRRTREIGLRKVFGARTRDIVGLLLWQFSIPVLVANVIAWPAAYFYLRHWLESYAYRIPLSPLYFVAAGGAALIIAWVTVIVHAAHVARANPINALRYE